MAEKSLNLNARLDESVSRGLSAISAAAERAQESVSDVAQSMAGATATATALEGAEEDLSRTSMALSGFMRAAASGIDKAGDEARETAIEMSALDAVMEKTSFSAGALSVNIGAFTIALRNIGTQIPLLITTAGTLISILGALSTAAIGAAAGLGTLFAAGAIARAEQLSEQLGDSADSAEVMQAMMGGIRDTFVDALEPLMNARNIAFFQRVIDGLAGVVNRFAQATSQMRDMFINFIDPVAQSFNENLDRIFNAFQFLMDGVSPMLQDFLIFLIERMPNALQFIAEVTMGLRDEMTSLFATLNDLVVDLINLAVNLGQTLIPILTDIIGFFEGWVHWLSTIDAELIGVVAGTLAFVVVSWKAVAAIDTLVFIGIAWASTLAQITAGATSAAQAMQLLALAGIEKVANALSGLAQFGQVLALVAFQGFSVGEAFEEAAEEADDMDENIDDAQRSLASFAATAKATSATVQDDLVEVFEATSGERRGTFPFASKPIKKKVPKTQLRGPGASFGFLPVPAETPSGMDKLKMKSRELGKAFGNLIGRALAFPAAVGKRMRQAMVSFKNSVVAAGKRVWALIGAVMAKIGAFITDTIATQGLAASLRGLAASAWGAVTAFFGLVAGALASAASFVTATAAAIGFGTAINAALGGIPILLTAIIGGAALIVGVLGNIDNISGGLKSTWDGLQSAAEALFDSILTIGVPAWNLFVEILNTTIAVLMIIPNILTAIFQWLGLVGENSSFLGTIWEGLVATLSVFIEGLALVLSFLEDIWSTFNDIIGANAASGLRTSKADVRSNVTEQASGGPGDDVTTRANPNLSVENNTTQNVENINARPEDKERLKGLVKDAMEEANTFRRRSQGF